MSVIFRKMTVVSVTNVYKF